MTAGKRVFILGPGYIGYSVLHLLIQEGYAVTGFVRRQEHADQITSSGATAILGDLNDAAAIAEQTAKHDIVLHTATADHLPSAQAILDGLKVRAKRGESTIYIHTSGTSVLDDGSEGKHKSEQRYNDDVRTEIDSVPDDAPHRDVDLVIVKTQKELGEAAKISIIIPPLIYGFNPIHKRLTIQIPTLTRFALKHGYAGHVGPGLAVESNVHVLDLARGYIVLLHHLEQSSPAESLKNPYYFCESTGDNEPDWTEIGSAIGEGLHKAGKIESPIPKVIPRDLYADLFGHVTPSVIGLNSRSRANRLRALGWRPTEKGWKECFLEDELPVILQEDSGKFAGYAGITSA